MENRKFVTLYKQKPIKIGILYCQIRYILIVFFFNTKLLYLLVKPLYLIVIYYTTIH